MQFTTTNGVTAPTCSHVFGPCTCEICGRDGDVEVHHIRKLKDLKARWRGRKTRPDWVKRMIALQRKTLVVCFDCHRAIHKNDNTKPKKSS